MIPKSSDHPALDESQIDQTELQPVEVVLSRYTKLRTESKIGTLAVKLAKESFFGERILVQCTVSGFRELPALPPSPLGKLKETLIAQFPQYWKNTSGFEPLWSQCIASINQCCKGLRKKAK